MRLPHGTDIGVVGRAVAEEQPALFGLDPSQAVLLHLALAYHAAQELAAQGVDLVFHGNPLVTPAIERAYREALYIRAALPAELVRDDILTRYGRLVCREDTKST